VPSRLGWPPRARVHPAEGKGNPSTDLWRVHRTGMVLQGDQLVVISTSEEAEPWRMNSGSMFMNDCT